MRVLDHDQLDGSGTNPLLVLTSAGKTNIQSGDCRRADYRLTPQRRAIFKYDF
jgi:hypothetical protein